MKIEIPFLYTLLTAFVSVLRLDSRNYIKMSSLFKYRDKILERISNNYQGVAFDEKIEFVEIDKQQALNNILEKYSDVFYLEKGNIYTTLELNETYKLLRDIDIPMIGFSVVEESKEILNILGIHKIFEDMKIIEEYGYKLEKEIEKCYQNNCLDATLKLLLYKRFLFIFNVAVKNKRFVENYLLISHTDGLIIDNKDYDYYNNSVYIKNDEEYPIDKEVYENSEFYENIFEEFNPIQQNIEEDYQYAIFGNKSLFEYKYNDYFTKLYMSENFNNNSSLDIDVDFSFDAFDSYTEPLCADKLATISFDIDEEFFVFYLTYVKKINELIELGNNDLIKIKNRLLYLLDDIKYCLFIKENFDRIYNEISNYEINEYSFEFFLNEAKYLIQDIFEGTVGKTIEKLLFIATYYEITHNNEIIEALSEYEDDNRYPIYSKIILGEQNDKRFFKK